MTCKEGKICSMFLSIPSLMGWKMSSVKADLMHNNIWIISLEEEIKLSRQMPCPDSDQQQMLWEY